MVDLGIPHDAVLNTVFHASPRLPCILLQTDPKYAAWISKALGLNSDSADGNYYSPVDGGELVLLEVYCYIFCNSSTTSLRFFLNSEHFYLQPIVRNTSQFKTSQMLTLLRMEFSGRSLKVP